MFKSESVINYNYKCVSLRRWSFESASVCLLVCDLIQLSVANSLSLYYGSDCITVRLTGSAVPRRVAVPSLA